MKTLLILRHAKSSRSDPSLADFDRPLNDRGRQDAPLMGALIRRLDMIPDRILSSSAKRTRETTVAVVDAALLDDASVTYLDELYGAEPADYVEALGKLPDEVESAMVVGHNPGLQELVEALSGRAEDFPTAALAAIRLPIDGWADLDVGVKGELAGIWRPRELE